MRRVLLAAAASAAVLSAVLPAGAAGPLVTYRDYDRPTIELRVAKQGSRLVVRRFKAFVSAESCGWRFDRGYELFGGATGAVTNDAGGFHGKLEYGADPSSGLVSGDMTFSGHTQRRKGQPASLVGTVSMTATGTADDDGASPPQTCKWGPIRFNARPPDKTPPRVTDVSIQPNPFHPVASGDETQSTRRGGVLIRYRLSEPGSVSIEFDRTSKAGCTKSGPLCEVSMAAPAKRGVNRRYWNGRDYDFSMARPIRPGTYRVTLVALDNAANKTTVRRTVVVTG